MKIFKEKKVIILILLLASCLRFYNLNWDQDNHLHPDERFLTFVGNAMKTPQSLQQYLDPQTSTFNPANLNHSFYVYGTFPVVMNKIIAGVLQTDNYNDFAIQGRLLSGLFDLMIVYLVYKTIALFEKKYNLSENIKYIGAFFYAVAVLPIQLSHFFAVDTFLSFFMLASLYETLKFYFGGRIRDLILSAILIGLALASKITALFLLPLILYFLVSFFLKKRSGIKFSRIILLLGIYGLVFYLVTRLTHPYMFQSGNLFDPRISQLFLTNLKALNEWFTPDAWYPPGVQWINKTPLFPFANIILVGLGPVYFLFVALGIFKIFKKPISPELIAIFVWVVVFSIFQSLQFAKTIRYYIIFYPYFAIFAAIGFTYYAKSWRLIYKVFALILIISWALMFFSIYTRKNTRITASVWIYQNIPSGSTILSEAWDDGLPLYIPQDTGKTFSSQSLPVFDLDTPEKWQKMNTLLKSGDYYILSSNRAWGSIMPIPKRYPRMSKYYDNLFAGKTNYKMIKEFTSYPSLRYLGIPFDLPDSMADENFSVFDHPQVIIFKNINSK